MRDLTLDFTLKEAREIGRQSTYVRIIRNLAADDDIELAARCMDVEISFMMEIKDTIEKNPEMDDEEIAEMIMHL